MMGHPIAIMPQLRSLSLNVLPQTLQNITVQLGVDSLTLGDKFKMHNPAKIKENGEHALGHAPDLPSCLWFWRMWALPLRRLLFGLLGHSHRPNSHHW